MDAVVLESFVLATEPRPIYEDSLTSYQFPRRYLRHFAPLSEGADMLAVIYEPRGRPPRGRMAYVGWAVLRGHPRPDASGPDNTYRVDFLEPVHSLEQPVPRVIDGEPVELWLREFAKGRQQNTATRGRAVRALSSDEVERILFLGATNVNWETRQGHERDLFSLLAEDSRVRQLVSRLSRSAGFRRDVHAAYGGQCAVSGLSADGFEGLIEAAHIRGAGHPECGPDHLTNGIALTPTLHRLFDRHLFSLKYQGDDLVVVISGQLTLDMVHDSTTGSRLKLEQGPKVRLPSSIACRPGREFIDYHRKLLRP